VDVGQAVLFLKLFGIGDGLVKCRTFEDDICTKTASGVDLSERSKLGQDYRRTGAYVTSGEGYTLGVVTGRGGDDSTRFFLVRELRDLVIGPAQFE